MIHVITSRNRHLYEGELTQHFRVRYDIYVRDRQWLALDRPVPLEVDQFDTLDAIYLLSIDKGKLLGGSRLIPSMQPHLLSEVFPYLAPRGVPRRADVFEWTRIFVAKDQRGANGAAGTAKAAGAGRSARYCAGSSNSRWTRASRPSARSARCGGPRASSRWDGRSNRSDCRRRSRVNGAMPSCSKSMTRFWPTRGSVSGSKAQS
ncbi:MAG: hypothetical protein HC900_12165 [Methylacidiphilales bacterium]|nr:hypothetical protein [Candidatus Methylacidiphilales bacterium]